MVHFVSCMVHTAQGTKIRYCTGKYGTLGRPGKVDVMLESTLSVILGLLKPMPL